jgi:hypothetical protein
MPPPPTDPRAAGLARQKLTMTVVCAALVLGALLLLVLPVALPLPLRLGVAAFDLAAAATVWLVGRQQFSGR